MEFNFLLQIALLFTPMVAAFFSVFGFCRRYSDVPFILKWAYDISYFRAGFHGAIDTALGMNKSDLHCPNDQLMSYCHYRSPKLALRDAGIDELNFGRNIQLMTIIFITMHVLTLATLWFRLNKR